MFLTPLGRPAEKLQMIHLRPSALSLVRKHGLRKIIATPSRTEEMPILTFPALS
jgi:hypothetical protein